MKTPASSPSRPPLRSTPSALRGAPSAVSTPAPSRSVSGPGKVRIIGGQWKRTPISVPNVQGLRPTPDRVRETVFNWIGPSIKGLECLDLFGGSGALGFEAASRGAARVVVVESNRQAIQAMSQLKDKLKAQQIELLQADAFLVLHRLPANSLDMVFLDPPFGQGLIQKVWPLLTRPLKAQARVYVEAEAPFEAESPFISMKTERAGQVYYHLLQYNPHTRQEDSL
jgi:16S rRNA (guanine966-N2)-methyltransferase